jgi:hypothetical protein
MERSGIAFRRRRLFPEGNGLALVAVADGQARSLVVYVMLDEDFVVGLQIEQQGAHLLGAIKFEGFVKNKPLPIAGDGNNAVTRTRSHDL